MLESLTQLLNSPQGLALRHGLKVIFLALLALTVFALFAAPAGKTGKTRYTLLRVIFVGSFGAVLCVQTFWQIFGFTHPPFVRFLRRYNRRPNATETQILRGAILDRRGFLLAAPVPGDVWGRRYPLGEAAVHPIGYYHPKYGITAVERVEDPILGGYSLEGENAPLAKRLLAPRAKEGGEVSLTLDSRLQQFAYNQMNPRKGAVVVLSPRTGDLLALVSSPGFDPLAPDAAMRDGKNKPVFNRAVQGLYPPGSTFKLVIAGMALDCGKSPVLDCPGTGYVVGPNTPPIRDSEYYAYARADAVWPGWGRIGLKDALAYSSNVYFAQLAVSCGTDPFNVIIRKARLNTSIRYLAGCSGELKTAPGHVPTLENPRLLAYPAIGQGKVLLTPLHVACYTAAVAADGLLPTPRLAMDDPDEPPSRLFSARAARVIRAAMREAVTRGTGKAADVPGLSVCGKTGTAQTAQGADHAWFTCFAPEQNPALVVTVLVEHGGFGAKSALPVARNILEEACRLGYFGKNRKGAPP